MEEGKKEKKRVVKKKDEVPHDFELNEYVVLIHLLNQ